MSTTTSSSCSTPAWSSSPANAPCAAPPSTSTGCRRRDERPNRRSEAGWVSPARRRSPDSDVSGDAERTPAFRLPAHRSSPWPRRVVSPASGCRRPRYRAVPRPPRHMPTAIPAGRRAGVRATGAGTAATPAASAQRWYGDWPQRHRPCTCGDPGPSPNVATEWGLVFGRCRRSHLRAPEISAPPKVRRTARIRPAPPSAPPSGSKGSQPPQPAFRERSRSNLRSRRAPHRGAGPAAGSNMSLPPRASHAAIAQRDQRSRIPRNHWVDPIRTSR